MSHLRSVVGVSVKDNRRAKIEAAREMFAEGKTRKEIYLALTTRFGSALEESLLKHIRADLLDAQDRDRAVAELRDGEVLVELPPPVHAGLPEPGPRVYYKPERYFDDDQRLDALLFAEEYGEDEACRRFGVKHARLHQWRAEVEAAPEAQTTPNEPVQTAPANLPDAPEVTMPATMLVKRASQNLPEPVIVTAPEVAAVQEEDAPLPPPTTPGRHALSQAKGAYVRELLKLCPYAGNHMINRLVRDHFIGTLGHDVGGLGIPEIGKMRRESTKKADYRAWLKVRDQIRGIATSEAKRAKREAREEAAEVEAEAEVEVATPPTRQPVPKALVVAKPLTYRAAADTAVEMILATGNYAGCVITYDEGMDEASIEVSEKVVRKKTLK